jgi:hypothetical protein
MVCLIDGMRFHPSRLEGCVSVFDGGIFFAAVLAAMAMC